MTKLKIGYLIFEEMDRELAVAYYMGCGYPDFILSLKFRFSQRLRIHHIKNSYRVILGQ